MAYTSKKAKKQMMSYLDADPTERFLTASEVLTQYPELKDCAVNPNSCFMWNNTVITVKFN